MLNCLCCNYKTIEEHWDFDICPVCFWEDDVYIDFNKVYKGIFEDENVYVPTVYSNGEPSLQVLLDLPSGANNDLTLRQARENYVSFGACEKDIIPHVRMPNTNEK